MDKVKVALIGAGGMANGVHYPSLAAFDDVEMVGLCDLVEDKLNETADKFGIEKRYTNYQQMIEETNPDGVYVLMPPHHLFDVAISVLSQGINLFIEKPPGVTVEQTRQMAIAADANNVLAMAGFNRRYIPLMLKCKEMVNERGDMLHCVSTFYKHHFGGPYYKGAIDVLTCDAIHAVDTMRWMAGSDVQDVVGDVRYQCEETYANAFNALCRFENQCSGVLLTNWCIGKRVHTFEMHAKGISAFIDCNSVATVYADNSEEGTVLDAMDVAGSEENRVFYGFEGQARHFIDCVKNSTDPDSSMDDAVKTMELVADIYATSL